MGLWSPQQSNAMPVGGSGIRIYLPQNCIVRKVWETCSENHVPLSLYYGRHIMEGGVATFAGVPNRAKYARQSMQVSTLNS